MTTTLPKSDFDKLPKASQEALISKGVQITEDVIDVFGDNETAVEAVSETSKYDIEGDAVYLNVNIAVNGHKLRLKGIKLTQKNVCLDNWDKDSKEFTGKHIPTMSLIEAVRTHGADKVNDVISAEVSVGKAGERNETLIDLFG